MKSLFEDKLLQAHWERNEAASLVFIPRVELLFSFSDNTLHSQGCHEGEDFCEVEHNYPEEKIRSTMRHETSRMERELLFSKLDNFERDLVRSRVRGDTSAVQVTAASDKLESNLINETPLCDYVESFVYPRTV